MELQRLIEAVEQSSELFPSDFPSEFKGKQWAIRAYYGSLDAARALHDELLPRWDWQVFETNGKKYAVVDGPLFSSDECQSILPARAWLLAILKSYQQVQREKE